MIINCISEDCPAPFKWWCCKALLMRGDARGLEMLKSNFERIEQKSYNNNYDIIQLLHIVVSDDEFLCKSGFSKVKSLYKQRVYNLCSTILYGSFSASSSIKVDLLLILLKNIPREVIQPDMKYVLVI